MNSTEIVDLGWKCFLFITANAVLRGNRFGVALDRNIIRHFAQTKTLM